jgi:hypothetical protein
LKVPEKVGKRVYKKRVYAKKRPPPKRTDKRPRKGPTQEEARLSVEKRKGKFLVLYSQSGYVAQAANEAGLPLRTLYNHLKSDAEFKEEMSQARKESVLKLEDEARRRAMDGVLVPKTVAGKQVMVREYSDTLLIFLLKGNKPEKYRDRVDHKASVQVSTDVDQVPDGFIKTLERMIGGNGSREEGAV